MIRRSAERAPGHELLEGAHDGGDLGNHGIYPAYFYEVQFYFNPLLNAAVYNTEDHAGKGAEAAIDIMDGMRGWMTGMGIPHLVIDAPGGYLRLRHGGRVVITRHDQPKAVLLSARSAVSASSNHAAWSPAWAVTHRRSRSSGESKLRSMNTRRVLAGPARCSDRPSTAKFTRAPRTSATVGRMSTDSTSPSTGPATSPVTSTISIQRRRRSSSAGGVPRNPQRRRGLR